MNKLPKPFVFETLVVCNNPMEIEIYPATLREQEIPHRTEWASDGSLVILVAQKWHDQARQALSQASKIFFGQELKIPVQNSQPKSLAYDAMDPNEQLDAYEEEFEMDSDRWNFFGREKVFAPKAMQAMQVWPAWVLSALPGLGLGHFYARKIQTFFYLVAISVLGLLFYHFTQSALAFLLILFSWSMDLGFAAFHVKEHNRVVLRNQRSTSQDQCSLSDSMHEEI